MKRIVITGLGVVSPIGIGLDEFWSNAIKGVVGTGPIAAFDVGGSRSKVGGEVKGFDPENHVRVLNRNEIGRGSQFAIAAARMALKDAGIETETIDPERVGVSIGTTMGEPQVLEKINTIWLNEGPDKVSPDLYAQYPCCVIPANVAKEFCLEGPNIIITTACAAGNYAIGYGFDKIRSGQADVMIVGGIDPFSKVAFAGFNRLLSVSPDLCRPFDLERKGLIVSEGAGILILESLDSAKARNANVYAEIKGCGQSCSAYHMTTPHPEGEGAVRAMENALDSAGLPAEEVDYISAHGTGTMANDLSETIAIKRVFGNLAGKIPVSSIKSMLGHTMGAASAIEAVVCAMSIKNNVILPTVNYETPDPACDLDYVPNIAREQKLNLVMSNAYAFGGNDSSLLLGRV